MSGYEAGRIVAPPRPEFIKSRRDTTVKKKKQKSEFAWPFSKWRQDWIAEGDRLIAEAEDLIGGSPGEAKPINVRQCVYLLRAAKLYSRAARYYRQAGLGLMAQASWQDAADCYLSLGKEDAVALCEAKAKAIPTYYDEEEV